MAKGFIYFFFKSLKLIDNKLVSLNNLSTILSDFWNQKNKKKQLFITTQIDKQKGYAVGVLDSIGEFNVLFSLQHFKTSIFSNLYFSCSVEKIDYSIAYFFCLLYRSGMIYWNEKNQKFKYVYNKIVSDKKDLFIQYVSPLSFQSQKNISFVRWKKIRYRLLDQKYRSSAKSIKRFQRLLTVVQNY